MNTTIDRALLADIVTWSHSNLKLLWGMGDIMSHAYDHPLTQQASIGMLTTWNSTPNDLNNWLRGFKTPGTFVQNRIDEGYALHLVVWMADHHEYAVSEQFQADIRELATIFRGPENRPGDFYVTLFSEFETHPNTVEARTALRDAYLAAYDAIHEEHPRAYVGLGFGGYRWLHQETSDLSFWQPCLERDDIHMVQHMHGVSHAHRLPEQIRRSVKQLGADGKPVMQSHFEIWGDDALAVERAFHDVMDETFRPDNLAALIRDGLRVWAWKQGAHYLNPDLTPSSFRRVCRIIDAHAEESSV